jgi:hypothetical protein
MDAASWVSKEFVRENEAYMDCVEEAFAQLSSNHVGCLVSHMHDL